MARPTGTKSDKEILHNSGLATRASGILRDLAEAGFLSGKINQNSMYDSAYDRAAVIVARHLDEVIEIVIKTLKAADSVREAENE